MQCLSGLVWRYWYRELRSSRPSDTGQSASRCADRHGARRRRLGRRLHHSGGERQGQSQCRDGSTAASGPSSCLSCAGRRSRALDSRQPGSVRRRGLLATAGRGSSRGAGCHGHRPADAGACARWCSEAAGPPTSGNRGARSTPRWLSSTAAAELSWRGRRCRGACAMPAIDVASGLPMYFDMMEPIAARLAAGHCRFERTVNETRVNDPETAGSRTQTRTEIVRVFASTGSFLVEVAEPVVIAGFEDHLTELHARNRRCRLISPTTSVSSVMSTSSCHWSRHCCSPCGSQMRVRTRRRHACLPPRIGSEEQRKLEEVQLQFSDVVSDAVFFFLPLSNRGTETRGERRRGPSSAR